MNAKYTFEQRLNDIRKGIYSFRELGSTAYKEDAERIFLEEYNNGTITDKAKAALLQYQVDKIKSGKIIIDEVPDVLKSIIKEKIKL